MRLAGAELDSSRHVCALFNTPDEQYRVLLPFIKDGFAAGDRVIHIVDPAAHQNYLHGLAQAGINVDAAQASGQLEVRRWEEAHIRHGRFCQDGALDVMQHVLRAGKAQNYRMTRFVTNMDWALKDCPGSGTWSSTRRA